MRAAHVVLAGVLHDIDVKAVAAQRRGQRAGVVDRLGQRRAGVGIMTVADHQRDPRSPLGGIGALLGGDRLGGIQRPLVQRGMGADRQRHHADQSGGNGDRAAGDAELPDIHRGSFLVIHGRAKLVAPRPFRFEGVPDGVAVQLRSICGTATNKPLTRRGGSSNRQPGEASCGPGHPILFLARGLIRASPPIAAAIGASVISVTFVFPWLFV